MRPVWLVVIKYDYEGTDVEGVWPSRKLAQDHVKRILAEGRIPDGIRLDRWKGEKSKTAEEWYNEDNKMYHEVKS